MRQRCPSIDGVVISRGLICYDPRGELGKVPIPSWPVGEKFYSWSKPRVLRGMHLQAPPHAADKLVTCLHGRVMDVVLDLRPKSLTFSDHRVITLYPGDSIEVPVGLAHGFYVLEGPALLLYQMSAPYAPEADAGVSCFGCGITWPDDNPIMSRRDQELPIFEAKHGDIFA